MAFSSLDRVHCARAPFKWRVRYPRCKKAPYTVCRDKTIARAVGHVVICRSVRLTQVRLPSRVESGAFSGHDEIRKVLKEGRRRHIRTPDGARSTSLAFRLPSCDAWRS
ncbi:Piso0_003314 [Millerozyma farinosa CBS 7064]|uniref:Piso0_003314 protein n=1 Tax=Pichia sorbitophila (strain ATCC MYA-4447 / BCRC 22081 / CBS 7064 / NBRC 10061 / NRRL Y-12695) TaxID=559304 RepID=G8YHS5_PICSO|nr:Piso0_003314 [Millerozyma farinosa CBS 7064]CCE80977.1 Piso0_003314 [Millerozyma farinosa CBS 7064]